MADDRESFAGRWSRRKLAHDQGQPDETVSAAPDTDAIQPIDPDDLPPVESLTPESDFTVFLREGVPPALKKAALAKLWRSDPVLANLDGLNDYDEDFTGAAAKSVVATAYKVGKGFARKITESESRAQGGEKDAEAQAPDDPVVDSAEAKDDPDSTEDA